MTRVYGKTENSIQNTKWIKIFKRRPEYMITSRSWVAVQNPSKIGAANFAWGIGEVWVFFTLTHTGSQRNSFISPTDHKYGRIWSICGSKRVVSRPDVPFWGIVDEKSCLWVQIPQNPFLGPFNAKPNIERALRKSHVNAATMLKLYSYIGIGKYLGACRNFSAKGCP